VVPHLLEVTNMHFRRFVIAFLVGALGVAVGGIAAATLDEGPQLDDSVQADALNQYGVGRPLPASSTNSVDAATATADPTSLVTLAPGLKASVVTASAAPNIDMMALWPDDAHPTHLIACNEQGATEPGLQRISLTTGAAETILTGTTSCDPLRRTPWGTIVFGEENGNSGRLFELLDPLNTTGVTLNGNTFTGGIGAQNLALRSALGTVSYEGIVILDSGVVYYTDENRPLNGTAGGAYFKFIPTAAETPGPPITNLDDSPLVAGNVYGLRLGKRSGNTDYGQGTETGLGTWVPLSGVAPIDLRASASTLKLTGYYRPEDLELDRGAYARGIVRMCGDNTGNEFEDHTWGNTTCLTDGSPTTALADTATPEVQYLVIGSANFAMMDNIAYQAGRGNWIIHEDGDISSTRKNNDLWDCFDDGPDVDALSDGCIRIGTLNDLTSNNNEGAEWTGGFFDGTGAHFYVSVQHNVTGHGVIIDITGWR
jgi:secreted PhoX family phosphatase